VVGTPRIGNQNKNFSHFQFRLLTDCEEEVTNLRRLDANRNGCITKKDGNDNERTTANSAVNTLDSKLFLDTRAMCNSPSANYYKPTDEPEPWDLTQLNIEASVMCLVSKVSENKLTCLTLTKYMTSNHISPNLTIFR